MIKSNKPKWEIKYEELLNINVDEKLSKLSIEKDNLKIDPASNKEDYRKNKKDYATKLEKIEKETKELKDFKANKDKIAKLINYREKEKSKVEELEKELKIFKDSTKLLDEKNKLEEENTKLLEEDKEITNKLKNKNLTEKEKSELLSKKEENKKLRIKNSEDYFKNSEALGKFPKINLNEEQLKSKIIKEKTMISKTNMVCRNLMNGKSWDDIQVSLSNWDKDKKTDKKVEPKTTEEAKNEALGKSPNNEEKEFNFSPIINKSESGTHETIEYEDIYSDSSMDEKNKEDKKEKTFNRIVNAIKHPINTIKELFKRTNGKEEILNDNEEIRKDNTTKNTTDSTKETIEVDLGLNEFERDNFMARIYARAEVELFRRIAEKKEKEGGLRGALNSQEKTAKELTTEVEKELGEK